MNTKLFKKVVAACMAAMFMAGCASHDIDAVPEETTENEQTLKVQLNASVTSYADEGVTRASDEWEWAEGTVLFVQFHKGSDVVRGHLTYVSTGGQMGWDASFSGQLSANDNCEIYYFADANVSDLHNVTLTSVNAIYADKNASYSVSGGVLTINSTLAPLTGRVRFSGTSGMSINVSGLETYCGYDADANELKTTTDAVSQTVASSGYTPYIYALFANQSAPSLNVSNSENGEGIMFVKEFSSSVLRAGESGVMTIPTESTNKGWTTMVAVESVSLSSTFLSLGKGESSTLVATVNPSGVSDKTVTWTTSDASVATVNQSGKVTAVNFGTAVITATSKQDGSKKATCDVRVADGVKTFTVNGVAFNMILVGAGTFQMGASADGNNETPVHDVTITRDFYMGETEVTQALWETVTGLKPVSTSSYQWSQSKGLGADYPAYNISYNDVQTFITNLNNLTGLDFRMPTEAEWEYAAKGGNRSKGYVYSGGNSLGEVAWYESNTSSSTSPVKKKEPNELGLYDMSGNVWEWCSDWYGTYSSNAQTDPIGADTGSQRVYRGGSWNSKASYCSVVYRDYNSSTSRGSGFGVRLALTAK